MNNVGNYVTQKNGDGLEVWIRVEEDCPAASRMMSSKSWEGDCATNL